MLVILPVYSQPDGIRPVAGRTFNSHEIDSLQQLKKYTYKIPSKPPVSIWQRLRWYVGRFLQKIFQNTSGAKAFRYIIVAGVIALIIMLMVKANFQSMWSRETTPISTSFAFVDNPVEFDYSPLLEKAEQDGDFREAVRLWHFKTIKELHKFQWIVWKENKTNTDFLREIKDKGRAGSFSHLSTIYEHIWYGEFLVDARVYEQIARVYTKFHNELAVNE